MVCSIHVVPIPELLGMSHEQTDHHGSMISAQFLAVVQLAAAIGVAAALSWLVGYSIHREWELHEQGILKQVEYALSEDDSFQRDKLFMCIEADPDITNLLIRSGEDILFASHSPDGQSLPLPTRENVLRLPGGAEPVTVLWAVDSTRHTQSIWVIMPFAIVALGLLAGYIVLRSWFKQVRRILARVQKEPQAPVPTLPFIGMDETISGLQQKFNSLTHELTLCQQHKKYTGQQVEQLRTELHSHQAAEVMCRQQANRLLSVFNHSTHAMTFLAPDGRILEMNLEAQELLETTVNDVRGQHLWSLPALTSDPEIKNKLLHCRQGDLQQHMVVIDHSVKGPQHLDLSLKPILAEGNALEMLIVEGHNITERIRAEHALQETVHQFQQSQKMEAIGRLAGGIAHDFNNLLTSILGFSSMVQDQVKGQASVEDDISEVIQAANRAQNLTQKLLALSRKDAARNQEMDINALIREMENLLRITLHEDIDLSLQLSPRPCTVLCDPTSMEQVIVNLAVNARDAMPRSGRLTIRTMPVTLTASDCKRFDATPGSYIRLSVLDTGCGMSQEIIEHAFEPFFTTKEAGQGTGLGLSTTYAIVQQCGGFIDIRSKPGEGTDFRLYFPHLRDADARSTKNSLVGAPSELPRGDETILLVEDEAGVRKMATKLIESLGYTVLEAEDGEQGVGVAEKHRGDISLIITDVVMPHLSGPEMIDRLRVSVGHIPHLYVSGFTADKLKLHGADDSEHLLLKKPYSREQLAARIREVLDSE